MKKLLTLILVITMIMALVGCSDNTSKIDETKEDTTTNTVTNEVTETVDETTDTTTQGETSKWEIDPKSPTIDIETTIKWLDSLSIEDRYDWYAERFGEAFTEHLIDNQSATYDIFLEAYHGMPCELVALFKVSTKDYLRSPYNEAIGEHDGAELYKILSACGL